MTVRCATPITARQVRAARSCPARHPPHGAWPAEMRADVAAAFLDFDTTGQLYAAVLCGDALRPTGERSRSHGKEGELLAWIGHGCLL